MRVLVTRPLPDAEAFAAELAARGHQAVIEPLLKIAPVPDAALPEELDAFQALLITSAAGLRAFAALTERRDLPVFAVGGASAAAARDAGFAQVESAGGDVDDLIRLVRSRLSPDEGLLLQAAGSVVAGDLKGALEAAGFTVTRAVLYTAETATELTAAGQAALREGGVDAVAVFSPRTAETLVTLLRDAGLAEASGRLWALCLSQAVAAKLEQLTWAGFAVAARPETGALLEALERAAQDAGGEMTEAEAAGTPSDADAATPAVRVVGRFGGIRPMAQKLGVAVSTVQGWRERGVIPEARHKDILAAAAANGIELPEAELSAAGKRGAKSAAKPVAESKAVVESAKAEPKAKQSEAEKPAPKSSKATAASARPKAPADEAPKGGGWLFGFALGALVFLGGLVVAVLLRDTWLPLIQDPSEGAASAEAAAVAPGSSLASRLEGLEAAVKEAEARGAGDEVARLNQELTALRGGLQNLQSEVLQVRSQAGDRGGADLEALLADVNRRLDGLGGRVEALSGEAATAGDLRAELGLLAARLAAIERRLDGLPRIGPDGRLTLPQEVGFVLAVTQLRDALRFPQPFTEELEAVTRLTGDDAGLTAALAPLAGPAAQGIPTLTGLKAGFPAVARAIAVAGVAGESEGWLAEVKRSLSELVTVRPVGGDVEGADPAAVAARAEAKVAAGDLPGALEELTALSGDAAAAAEDWRAQAEARLAAETALRLLAARVIERLAPSAESGLPPAEPAPVIPSEEGAPDEAPSSIDGSSG